MSQRGAIKVKARFFADVSENVELTNCHVIEEDTLTLDITGVGLYTLMWTPTMECSSAHGYTPEDGLLGDIDEPESLAIAAGFALSEGFIRRCSDLLSLSVCPQNRRVIRIQLSEPENVQANRKNVVINSSCGICGPRELLENDSSGLQPVGRRLTLPSQDISRLMSEMRSRQTLFSETGGCHGAAIFDQCGQILAVAEDLGHHNALDKVIGKVLLRRGELSGCGVILSSRISLEMVLKAIRAGLEIVLAVSAPTSLAILFAERYGLTVCGFVRGSRATVYAHPERLESVNPAVSSPSVAAAVSDRDAPAVSRRP
tara:strand:+ start:382 stop:1326 length:945 start_codon:yes stop_codon:yes gene_type:complete